MCSISPLCRNRTRVIFLQKKFPSSVRLLPRGGNWKKLVTHFWQRMISACMPADRQTDRQSDRQQTYIHTYIHTDQKQSPTIHSFIGRTKIWEWTKIQRSLYNRPERLKHAEDVTKNQRRCSSFHVLDDVVERVNKKAYEIFYSECRPRNCGSSPGSCDSISSTTATQTTMLTSAVRIFEILNWIVPSVFDSIRNEHNRNTRGSSREWCLSKVCVCAQCCC